MARRMERRLENRTRQERRSLRGYQHQELRRIRSAETRARGLRLFIAWLKHGKEACLRLAAPARQPSIAAQTA